jgi:hypothetical protein
MLTRADVIERDDKMQFVDPPQSMLCDRNLL